MLPQRIEFTGQQLIQIRLGDRGYPNHNGVCGDVSQTLTPSVEPACHAAHKIECRQHVYEPHEIARHDLIELQTHAFRIDHAQTQEPLSDGLAAPGPLEKNSIADTDNEVTHGERGSAEAGTDQLE